MKGTSMRRRATSANFAPGIRYQEARKNFTDQQLACIGELAVSFASIAQLNIARSRQRPLVFSCWRIAHMYFGFRGAFGPMMRPAFQGFFGTRNMSGWRIATSLR